MGGPEASVVNDEIPGFIKHVLNWVLDDVMADERRALPKQRAGHSPIGSKG